MLDIGNSENTLTVIAPVSPAPVAEKPADASTASAAEEPGDRIGPYKLLQKIGEGGMGAVWMAEQTEPVRRRVALKVILQGKDSKLVLARFEAERQALALMDHPNIAKIFDAGVTSRLLTPSRSPNGGAGARRAGEGMSSSPVAPGRPYFVMELVNGIPLTKFCDEHRLSIRERLELFVPVCQAIQHAHQKGVIHRDISPSNVLVALYDGVPVPKVIDFGIAKAIGQRLTDRTLVTEFNTIIGKLEYMSPEQAEFNQPDIDTRSDIYGLGVLLYTLLTGTTPLTHEALRQAALDEVLRRIREVEPPRPSTRLSQSKERLASISAQRKLEPARLTKLLRGDLDWIVMKCLEKDRTRRYETANGLASDVRRHLGNEPVSAGPPTAAYRIAKFLRKHRGAVAVAAAFLALLVGATLLSTVLAVRANREREKATESQKEARSRALSEAREHRRAQEALTKMEMAKANELLEGTDATKGLAYLAWLLRKDPSNQLAAERLAWVLMVRNFALPACGPLQHDGFIFSAAFNADGRQLLTASEDRTARIWNALTGEELTPRLRHGDEVRWAEFSQDGRQVLTASSDMTARLWDAGTGKPIGQPLVHTNPVQLAHFSRDGTLIVTIASESRFRPRRVGPDKPEGTIVTLWRAETQQRYGEPLRIQS